MTRREREATQLRRQIEAAGLSQGQLAAALGLSIRKVNGQCSGREDVQPLLLLTMRYTPIEVLRELAGIQESATT